MLSLLSKERPPHNVFLALCIVSGDVKDSKCSCVAGSLGYCNHSLALMLKACKFSLYGSQNTKDLENEADQIPEQACTSKLQTWHQKGRGETIYPQPVMDVVVSKPNWRIQNVETKGFIPSFTRQEIIQCTTVQRNKNSSRQSEI